MNSSRDNKRKRSSELQDQSFAPPSISPQTAENEIDYYLEQCYQNQNNIALKEELRSMKSFVDIQNQSLIERTRKIHQLEGENQNLRLMLKQKEEELSRARSEQADQLERAKKKFKRSEEKYNEILKYNEKKSADHYEKALAAREVAIEMYLSEIISKDHALEQARTQVGMVRQKAAQEKNQYDQSMSGMLKQLEIQERYIQVLHNEIERICPAQSSPMPQPALQTETSFQSTAGWYSFYPQMPLNDEEILVPHLKPSGGMDLGNGSGG